MSVTAIATNLQAVVPMLALQVIDAGEDDHALPDRPHEDMAAAVADFLRRPGEAVGVHHNCSCSRKHVVCARRLPTGLHGGSVAKRSEFGSGGCLVVKMCKT